MGGLKKLIWILILGIAVFVTPLDSAAQSTDIGQRLCVLSNAGHLSADEAYVRAQDFDCSEDALKRPAQHLWLLAPVNDVVTKFEDPAVRMLMSYHGALTIAPVYGENRIEDRYVTPKEIIEEALVPTLMVFPVRSSEGEYPTHILIGVEKSWDPANWTNMQIVSLEATHAKHLVDALFYAIIIGLLMTPIIFSAVLYAVLRYSFLPFHVVTSVCALLYGVSWAGFLQLSPFAIEPIHRSVLNHVLIAMAFTGAAYLTRELCGRETLGAFWWRVLPIAGLLPLLNTTFFMAFAPHFSHYGSVLIHAAFILPLGAILGSLISGSLKGKLICKLQLLGWLPMFLYVAGRIARGMGLIDEISILELGLYPSLATEALLTTSIVGYRIYTLRKDHEHALLQQSILSGLASSDALTGALNRRAFIDGFYQTLASSGGANRTISLLAIDLDHFKAVNDEHGHAVGDEVLKDMTHLLKSHCREEDLCARFGGEEFCIMLNTSSVGAADGCARRLQAAIAEHIFPIAGKVTVSIGIVTVQADQQTPFESWYGAADKALYAAKFRGRNRVQRSGWVPDITPSDDEVYAEGWKLKDA